MFLSGTFLGLSIFKASESNEISNRREYKSIRINGNAIIDKLHIRNIEVDIDSLLSINITDNLLWTKNTLLLGEFEHNTSAGNVGNLTESVNKWQITRKESGSNILKVLDIVDVGVTNFIDYDAQTYKTYQYDIFALTDNQISQPLQTEEISNEAYGWFLIGFDSDGTTYVYKLDLEVTSGNIKAEEDFTEYASYSKYNSFAKGSRNFQRGTISAVAGDIQSNGDILQSSDYIDILMNRIQDISTKTLKSRKGEIWRVKTHGFTKQQLNDGLGQQIYIVNFEFIQCEDI